MIDSVLQFLIKLEQNMFLNIAKELIVYIFVNQNGSYYCGRSEHKIVETFRNTLKTSNSSVDQIFITKIGILAIISYYGGNEDCK